MQLPGWGRWSRCYDSLSLLYNTLPPFLLKSSTENNNSHQLATLLQTRAMCEQMMSDKAAAAAAVVFTCDRAVVEQCRHTRMQMNSLLNQQGGRLSRGEDGVNKSAAVAAA